MDKEGHVLNAILLGIGLGIIIEPSGTVDTLRAIVAVTIPVTLGALFPDVDTAFGKHRKTLHNIPVIAVFLAFPVVFGNLQYVWIGVLTHYVLDYLGSRRGIALFYPLSSSEYGFPSGVTTSSKYANAVTIVVTFVELAIAAAIVHVLPQYVDLSQYTAMLPV
ncbi:metal-dependent hydrolase [Natronomonas halophila]|uniref:metal-dependent hydrolase n=1 Tax=Natronomonas halophila TaxID=2747817 RepID=UPI0015B5C4B6|nr:metal-dependent hydrolase [Natronomonas halophila]QLD86526.1 metal-dependent hydrolase [Natronomonas halophila]